MKILQVAPQVPYPPEDGGKVGIYNITKHLARRGHDVTLFAFDRAPGTDYGPLREFCALHTHAHSTRNSAGGALLNIFSDLPYTISKYRSPDFLRLLVKFTQDHPVDVVHIDHLHMAAYGVALKRRSGPPIVLREHNVESVIMERYADHASNPAMRAYARLQQRRLRAYESRMVGLYDACCPITPDDASKIRGMNPAARLHIVPGGVEASYFAAPDESAIAPDSIVFFGGMDWVPNRDAVLWFLEEIFPVVLKSRPEATLTIVGKNVPDEVARHAGPRVLMRGYVEDLRAEIQRHAVSIAPFRIGGGMRLKIIESFAMSVPVVSTTIGCEGIGASHGETILIGDTPGEFAAQLVRLLGDGGMRRTVREAAFALASARYRWDNVAAMFEDVYRGVIAGGGESAGG